MTAFTSGKSLFINPAVTLVARSLDHTIITVPSSIAISPARSIKPFA